MHNNSGSSNDTLFCISSNNDDNNYNNLLLSTGTTPITPLFTSTPTHGPNPISPTSTTTVSPPPGFHASSCSAVRSIYDIFCTTGSNGSTCSTIPQNVRTGSPPPPMDSDSGANLFYEACGTMTPITIMVMCTNMLLNKLKCMEICRIIPMKTSFHIMGNNVMKQSISDMC